jgi:hypothetical protein
MFSSFEVNKFRQMPVNGYQRFVFFYLYWEIQQDLTDRRFLSEPWARLPIDRPVSHGCNLLANEAFSMPHLISERETLRSMVSFWVVNVFFCFVL